MKKIFILLLAACCSLFSMAQQNQEEIRVNSPLAFKTFRHAKIIQPFGRFIYADCNIFLKDSRLLYKENDTVKSPANMNIILSVEFDDTTKYVRIEDNVMARVLAEKNYNSLLCLTTINMNKVKEETTGGTNLPYFDMDGAFGATSVFLEINGDQWEGSTGFPLENKYFFRVKGRVIPAKEKEIKKIVPKQMRTAFKNLMADRWWSWNDAECLKQLLVYLP